MWSPGVAVITQHGTGRPVCAPYVVRTVGVDFHACPRPTGLCRGGVSPSVLWNGTVCVVGRWGADGQGLPLQDEGGVPDGNSVPKKYSKNKEKYN